MTIQVSVLTLRFDPSTQSFDDAPLREAQRGRVVLSAREHFFCHKDNPYLLMVLEASAAETRSDVAPCAVPPTRQIPTPPRDPEPRRSTTAELRESLPEAERPLFDSLCAWRRARAQDEAVPPYVILTNRQLAEVCHQAPRTKKGLLEIRGLGKRKAERYATEILGIVAESCNASPDSEPAP